MVDVKDQIYAALCLISENVSDLYPTDWAKMPAIRYTEEANNVFEKTDAEETLTQLRYRIDIWQAGNTSPVALQVDEQVSALGLTRTSCMDVEDPDGKLRHKQMIYEGVLDESSGVVYWYGSR